jgi:ribonuclease P protein component
MSDERFPKHERLRKRREYLQVDARKTRKLITGHLIILAARNPESHARLGITVSKRVGGAVQRNRMKRLLREIYRRNKEIFPHGYDFVLIARKQDRNTCYHTLLQEIQSAMGSRTW